MSRVDLSIVDDLDPSKGPELIRKACMKPDDYHDMSSMTESLTLSEITSMDEEDTSLIDSSKKRSEIMESLGTPDRKSGHVTTKSVS